MHITRLQLTDFRNYPTADLHFAPEGAVLVGRNGSGKTNLLEAIHVLCTGRSHREAERADLIRFGADLAFLAGEFASNTGDACMASIGFARDGSLSLKLNDQKMTSLSAWFGRGPVISLGPDDLNLVYGSPSQRRRFLDVLISQVFPGYLESLMGYRRSMLNRNRLLAQGVLDQQLDVYEESMARHGAIVCGYRLRAIEILSPECTRTYAEISNMREAGSVIYARSAGAETADSSLWENVFLCVLRKTRERDRERGFCSTGPHRDDLRFLLNGRPARDFGSQGQCRSLALSARLASVQWATSCGMNEMIILVDDAFSELDDDRVSAAYPLLAGRGQLFLTAPNRAPDRCSLQQFTIGEGSGIAA